jgi:hypothetical protein
MVSDRTSLTRRRFLQTGLAGAIALALARAAYGPFSPQPSLAPDRDFAYRVLGAAEQTLVAAIAPVLLNHALPDDAGARAQAIIAVVRGVDAAIAGLPPAVQEDIGSLFALLGFPITRRIVAGVRAPWLEAAPESIAAFLERWRTSRFALLNSGYRALHELITAAWYGNPASWPRIGYAGPPALGAK